MSVRTSKSWKPEIISDQIIKLFKKIKKNLLSGNSRKHLAWEPACSGSCGQSFFFFFLLRPKGETKTYISHPEPPPLRHNGTCLTKGCFFGFHHMQRRMDPRGRNPIRCVMFSGQAENGQQQHRGFSAQDPGRKLQAANTGSLDISRYLRLLIHSWLLPALWDWTHTGSLSLSLSLIHKHSSKSNTPLIPSLCLHMCHKWQQQLKVCSDWGTLPHAGLPEVLLWLLTTASLHTPPSKSLGLSNISKQWM